MLFKKYGKKNLMRHFVKKFVKLSSGRFLTLTEVLAHYNRWCLKNGGMPFHHEHGFYAEFMLAVFQLRIPNWYGSKEFEDGTLFMTGIRSNGGKQIIILSHRKYLEKSFNEMDIPDEL